VIDQVGEPIIGANISLKGQPGTGDITDIEGNFTLEVPEKAVLVISYIGYLTQEIPVNGKASFNIQMKEDTKTLDEVVVVGYGSQKKQTVTASASTLKVSSLKKCANRQPGFFTRRTRQRRIDSADRWRGRI